MIKQIEYPFDKNQVGALKVGDMVELSGPIVTGRDRFHKYLFDGNKSPVSLKDGAIYHCGPVVIRKDRCWLVRCAGPTTSKRQDPYMPAIIRKHHLSVIIGKGGMSDDTRKACAENGCVYLQAVGGAAALLARAIVQVNNVHFLKEFGMADAVWEFDVSGLRAVVTMDSAGRSLHRTIRNSSRREFKKLIF